MSDLSKELHDDVLKLREAMQEEIKRLSAPKAEHGDMNVACVEYEKEIEQLKSDPGLYATGDRAILEQNQKYKKEIERLETDVGHMGDECIELRKHIAELETNFTTVAMAVVLCDASNSDAPVMDPELYSKAMRVIEERDNET